MNPYDLTYTIVIDGQNTGTYNVEHRALRHAKEAKTANPGAFVAIVLLTADDATAAFGVQPVERAREALTLVHNAGFSVKA